MTFYKEVGSGMSGLKRSRASSTESQGSDEFLASETLLAVTAPTISFWTVSLDGSIACSAEVSVNSPHGRPTRGDANTLKLTCRWPPISVQPRACGRAGVRGAGFSPPRLTWPSGWL